MVCACCGVKKKLFDMFYSVGDGKTAVGCRRRGMGAVRDPSAPAEKAGKEPQSGIPVLAERKQSFQSVIFS